MNGCGIVCVRLPSANARNDRDKNVAHHNKQRQRFSKRLQVTSKLVIPFVRDDINSTQPGHPNWPEAIGHRRTAGCRFVFIE